MHTPRRTRASAAAIAATLILAACSGGSDPTDATGAPTSPAADAENDDGAGDTTVGTVGNDGTTVVDVAALEQSVTEVVTPDAEHRCERLGYTCSWSDLDSERFDDVLAVASEIQGIVDAADTPEAGLDAAVERLASEPVVELIVDREGLTGMLYRLEDTPELFATTALAAPIGDPVTLDLTELEADLDELVAAHAEPAGFGPRPRDYHPTGGPIVPKRGIVLDPYATEQIECPPQTPLDGCMGDSSGRIEGSVIYGVMNAHPQISVDYFAGSDVAPWNLTNLAAYDLVHIATHGSSGCANRNEGWTTGTDDPEAFVAEGRSTFRSTPLDPNECYSVSVLGPFDKQKYDAWGQRVPPGIGMNGERWAAVTDFFVGKLKADAIVYLSNCTSADGQLYSSGSYGSFVGWHSYAQTGTAYAAGIAFWRLMVVDGVEFDVAIDDLDDRQLTWSLNAERNGTSFAAAGAFLAANGKNQRARDVITASIDGDDLGGQVLRVAGLPGDGQPEFFPADEQVLQFVVEGVRDGTAGDVELELRADGNPLDADIELERDGVMIDEGDEWADWRVTVRPAAVKLPDTDAADYRPGAEPIELEVRAYVDQTEYSADKGAVTLGTRLASNGPLPIFTELAAGMPANGEIRGNDLEIEFDTAGGEVTGSMRVEMLASGINVGFWQLDLTGSYDPESGTMTGDLVGVSEGGIGGITSGDSGSGTWQATADLDAKQVQGTLGIGTGSQPYVGTITSASATG